MSTSWLPNGCLKDGTYLFGPLKTRPTDMGLVVDLNFGNKTFYVVCCCKMLSDILKQEVQEWAQKKAVQNGLLSQ
jgi:hypothetical protein